MQLACSNNETINQIRSNEVDIQVAHLRYTIMAACELRSFSICCMMWQGQSQARVGSITLSCSLYNLTGNSSPELLSSYPVVITGMSPWGLDNKATAIPVRSKLQTQVLGCFHLIKKSVDVNLKGHPGTVGKSTGTAKQTASMTVINPLTDPKNLHYFNIVI
jgi:hypothetical protein